MIEYAPRSLSHETARVMRIDPENVWVEGIDRNACGSCALRGGCGQGLLSSLWAKPPLLKISRRPHDAVLAEGDIICVAIPGAALVSGAILLYLLPLFCLLSMAVAGHLFLGNEGVTALFAAGGLLLGGALVRLVSIFKKNNESLRPSIIAFGEDLVPAEERVLATCSTTSVPTTAASTISVSTKAPEGDRQ